MAQRPRNWAPLFDSFASEESQKVAAAIDSDVQGRKFIPLRRDFLRSPMGQPTPLKQLYSGGRGGRNALLIYLAHLWLAVKEPHEIRGRSAYGWAQLLDLDISSRNGLRVVHRALDKLAEHRLIELVSRPGKSPIVRLLREDGSGDAYYFPGNPKARRKAGVAKQRDWYLQLPTRWWVHGVVPALSGPELAMLLVMIDAGADKGYAWISGDHFQTRYQLSPSTRYEGLKGLIERGLLECEHIPVQPFGGKIAWEAPRKRHQYTFSPLAREVFEDDRKAAQRSKSKPSASAKA